MAQDPSRIHTLGELKAAGYRPRSVKDELRANLILRMKAGQPAFPGIFGYEDTVVPDLERAVLSRHNVLLLGLRGQAKTRIARLMTGLLDEYVPIVAGSELHDDPMQPLSRYARDLIAEKGDDTPVEWLHRDQRYAEKLATPDVSVADLIGDADPIKAANLRLPYSDERVIHFGLIPRAHRGIFVINELPDLQPRIQVALFNILQEGDIQIRGFNLRLPLDIQFVFTANPEDYTNRGSIVTPLKDRIESQILTHYPRTVEISRQITETESRPAEEALERVAMHPLVARLVEQVAIEARQSEYVDQNSGVSARLTISAYENLISAAERRALRNREKRTLVRVSDLWGLIPAVTGKIELVYEGEQEGAAIVARNLLGKAIRSVFPEYFPNPEKLKRSSGENPYQDLVHWFGAGQTVDLTFDSTDEAYRNALQPIPGLEALVRKFHADLTEEEVLLFGELLLYGLSEYSLIGKSTLDTSAQFSDLISGMFSGSEEDEDEFGGGHWEDA